MNKKYMGDIFDILNLAPRIDTQNEEEQNIPKYPPTNICYDTNETIYIEVMVGGFVKEELSIDLNENILEITGVVTDELNKAFTYIQKDFEIKDFVRKIKLKEEYINGEFYADLSNGVLCISITPIKKDSTKFNIEIN